TGRRRTPGRETASPASRLPAIATAVSAPVSSRSETAPGRVGAKTPSWTFAPTSTKKTGTNRSAVGRSSSWIRVPRSVLARTRPAAKAPMIVASPSRSESAASPAQNATAKAADAADEPRGEPHAEPEGDGQEREGGEEGRPDRGHRHAPGLRHAGDAGQDDEPEDVVDHRGAQDGPRAGVLEPPEVGEHPGGDPHAGGGQRRADQDGRRPRQ